MKKIFAFAVALLFLFAFVYAELEAGDINPKKNKIGGTIDILPMEKVIRQIQVDENYPCYLEGENIICEAIKTENLTLFKNELGIVDKTRLNLFGVPVRNIEGSLIESKSIDPTIRNIIPINLSKNGIVKIGFNTNIFEVTNLNYGIHNQTASSSSGLIFLSSDLSATYQSKIIDFNKTSSIINLTYISEEPSGTDIKFRIRTYNTTVNEAGTLSEGLYLYLKMDDVNEKQALGEAMYNTTDFSGYNQTFQVINGVTTKSPVINISLGKYDSSMQTKEATARLRIRGTGIGLDGGEGLTIGGWIYPKSAGINTYYGRIMEKGDGNSYSFNFEGNNRLSCKINYHYMVMSSRDIPYNQWSHVLCIYDATAGTMIIYVNGVAHTTDTGASLGTVNDNNYDIGIGNTIGGSRTFNGFLDEIVIYNRSLSLTEVNDLYTNGVRAWNEWSSWYSTSPIYFSEVNDGRFAQVEAKLERSSSSTLVYLKNFTVGYGAIGEAPPLVDNPPTADLITPNSQNFKVNSFTLNYSATDDINLSNGTLYANWSEGWHLNETHILGETSHTDYFNTSLPDGSYFWNVLVCDNKTAPDCVWGNKDYNFTFTVSTACVDTDCYPYVCNNIENTCYTTCNSHSQVNASSYCGSDSFAHDKLNDGQSCAGLEYSELADNNICFGGYCYTDDFETFGEYCTDISDGCVDEGIEYNSGQVLCLSGSNDFKQCVGGDIPSPWDGVTDCIDGGDLVNGTTGTPTLSSHAACGYYSAQSCSTSTGCIPVDTTIIENECGDYAAGSGACLSSVATSCDVGCGADYDLDTCPEPNTLSDDCSTCTPPAVDNPPVVNLHSPTDSSTQTDITITFQYKVNDENELKNCSLYYNTTSVAWHFGGTNTSRIFRNNIVNSFDAVTLTDGDDVTWNVLCVDSLNNASFAGSNWTFSIDITVVPDIKFEIYNDTTEASDLLISVSETGDVNITGNLYVSGDSYLLNEIYRASPVLIPELRVQEYIAMGDADLLLTNPYSDYLKINGSRGSIMFGFYDTTPIISTDTGDRIAVNKILEVYKRLYTYGYITIGKAYNNTPYKTYPLDVFNKSEYIVANFESENYGMGIRLKDSGASPVILSSTEGSFGVNVGGKNNSLVVTAGRWTGINTAQPSYEFEVNGSANITNTLYAGSLWANNTRVGIGTASPTHTLNVVGQSNFTDNVGIKTAGSTYALDVHGIIRADGNGSNAGSFIATDPNLVTIGGLMTMEKLDGTDVWRMGLRGAGGGLTNDLHFVNLDGSWYNVLVLDGDDQRVGIGTATPTHTLNVVGTTNLTGDLNVNGNIAFTSASKFITNANGYLVIYGNQLYLRSYADGGFIYIGDNLNTTVEIAGQGGNITLGANKYSKISVGGVNKPTDKLTVNGSVKFLNASGYQGIYQDSLSRVGIATTVPDSVFEIIGNTTLGDGVDDISSLSLVNSSKLIFDAQGNVAEIVALDIDYTIQAVTEDGFSSQLEFANPGGNKLSFTSAGFFGVNTANPTHTLNVVGTANITGDISAESNVWGTCVFQKCTIAAETDSCYCDDGYFQVGAANWTVLGFGYVYDTIKCCRI